LQIAWNYQKIFLHLERNKIIAMKKHLFAIPIIFSMVTISMGCSDKKEALMGFTPQQIEALGPKIFAKLCSAEF
jgi:hypothetical protein